MDTIPHLLASLETIEFWINTHFDDRVCITLQNIEGAIKTRHRILKRLLKIQIREFNRD